MSESGSTADRVTPKATDVHPNASLVLGLLTIVLAPIVVYVVDVGPIGALVPLLGVAAHATTKAYKSQVEYSPPGNSTMRRADLGRLLGITGALFFMVAGLTKWVIGNEQLVALRSLFADPTRFAEAFPVLLFEGLRITLIVWIGAVLLGQLLGTVLALMAISKRQAFRWLSLIYIDIFRGLPAIITIALVGIGVPLAGLRPFGRNQIAYATFALGLVAAAYIAEIVRAGIQSIEEGQMEAARSLGMPHGRAMRLVIIPQGLRRVVPPLTNEFIALLKDTSLIFVLGLTANSTSFWDGRDLFRVGQNLAQQNGNYSSVVLAGVFYLVMTIPLTRLTNYLDKRLREGRTAEDRGGVEDTATPGMGPASGGDGMH